MKILQFNVEYLGEINTLIANGCLLTWYELECNLHIFHISFYGILPEYISVLLADGNCLFNHLRQLKSKFMGHFMVSSTAPFHYGNNSVSFLQDMMNPPFIRWLIMNTLGLNNFTHDVEPSFHSQQMPQPVVDFLRLSLPLTTTFSSSTLRAESFFLRLICAPTRGNCSHHYHAGHILALQWH